MRGRVLVAAAALVVLAAPAGAQITPGQWEMTTTVQQADTSDIPPAFAAMLKRKPITVKQCITPEDAKNGPREFLKGRKNCEVAKYSMSGGRMTSTSICTYGSTTMTSTFAGSYTPTSFSGTSRQVMSGTGGAPHTTVVTVDGRLTGPCK